MQGKFLELGFIVKNFSNKQNLFQWSRFAFNISDDIDWC